MSICIVRLHLLAALRRACFCTAGTSARTAAIMSKEMKNAVLKATSPEVIVVVACRIVCVRSAHSEEIERRG